MTRDEFKLQALGKHVLMNLDTKPMSIEQQHFLEGALFAFDYMRSKEDTKTIASDNISLDDYKMSENYKTSLSEA